MVALLEHLKRCAREGGEPSQNATKIEHLARQNRYMTTDGQEILILNSQERLRREVQDDAGRMFNVAGYRGHWWDKSTTVRRRIREIGGK